MRRFLTFYLLFFILLLFFSYGYVDFNLTLSTKSWYQKFQVFFRDLAFQRRPLATLIFLFFWLVSFTFYFFLFFQAKNKKVSKDFFKKLVWVTVLGAFFSYPFLSNDVFNYIFTAKILTFYHENPYVVMPEEFIGDPWLSFLHWSNRTALYGPSWLILSTIPSFLARQNLALSLFCFKGLIVLFYLATVFLLVKLLNLIRTKENLSGLVFFTLNPLVLLETLVSAHNDIILVFFALLSFYLLMRNHSVWASLALLFSILIKFATVFLLPVFLYTLWLKLKNQKLVWPGIFTLASLSMYLVYFLSPLREELYPWYLIWVTPFVVLAFHNRFLVWLTVSLSAGTLLRYAPFLYTGSWGGMTPQIKFWVTVTPVILVFLKFSLEKFLKRNENCY